jgi:hypothetical protein
LVSTEATASVASLPTITVALVESLSATVSAFIHGAVARNVANLAASKSETKKEGAYICSSQIRRCAFHHLVEGRLPVEDIPWRDVQSLRSGSTPCSWGAQGSLERDVQPLDKMVSTNSGVTLPSSHTSSRDNRVARNTSRLRGGYRGAYDCSYNFTPRQFILSK